MQRGVKISVLAVVAGLAVGLACAAEATGTIQPEAVGFVGVYRLRDLEPGLTGEGLRVGVLAPSRTYLNNQPQNDYQPDCSHPCLASAQIAMHDNRKAAPGLCPHTTAVCSILVGQDQGGSMPGLGRFSYQGVIPKAQLDVYELWHFLTRPLLQRASPGLDLLTISGGSDFEEWWTRALEAMAEDGVVVVASIGNGSDSLHPPLYPGAAPNVIAVGMVDPVRSEDLAVATSNFWLVQPEHSSCGPTADGRCKPDLVAPGTCIVPSSSDDGRYELASSGSSFATPIVAGIAGILIQKARQEPALAAALSPRTCAPLLKAILLNSAVKLPHWHKGRIGLDDDHQVPLDYAQGAGLVDAIGAYSQLVSGRFGPGVVPPTGWDVAQIDRANGQVLVYQFDLEAASGQVITATLAWNCHYEHAYPFNRLVERTSDLRLELWAIDPARPQRDVLIDLSDSPVDNVEHIHAKADGRYSRYQLVVTWSDRGQSVARQEPFAIAWRTAVARTDSRIAWEDLNGDGVVDQKDYTRLIQNWVTSLRSPGRYTIGDLNADGRIDQQDLEILGSRTRIGQ